jgi:hypothetical protein
MSLASEDKQQLREIRRLLEEIRDLLKSPPVTIERRKTAPPPISTTYGRSSDD